MVTNYIIEGYGVFGGYSIQLALELRFNSKGLALMPLIEKIKDIEILKLAIKSDSLDAIKTMLS